jgi:hypothetical protein
LREAKAAATTANDRTSRSGSASTAALVGWQPRSPAIDGDGKLGGGSATASGCEDFAFMHSTFCGGRMEHLTAIIGHLAWPITAAAFGLVILKELKGGILGRILPNGGFIEGAGFKFETYAAKQSVQNANVEVVEPIEVRGISPYDQVMDAWRELATVVTTRAVQHGGVEDLRRINDNLKVLSAANAYDPALLRAVGKLFQARNSARQHGADSMAEADAVEFVATANALAKVFSQ